MLTFLHSGVLAAVLLAATLFSALAATVQGAVATCQLWQTPTLGATGRYRSLYRTQDQAKQAAALFESGQQAHQKGDLEKAIELYTQALKRDPELWQAELQRGAAYFSQNKLNEARASLLRVVEQLKAFADAPELRQIGARVQTTLGEIALAAAKPDEAEQAFRRALELNPQAARAHAGLAELLLAHNKPAEAITPAQAALTAGDDRAATFALLGVAQSLTGKHDEALPNFNEALKREPKNAPALLYRAEAFIAKNRLNEAIADLRAALTIEPNSRTRLRLAAALAQTKQFAEANKLYQEVLQEDPANTEARTALAAAMIEAGQGSEAIAQLESLIKAEPNRATLRAQLAELYLPTQPEQALAEYGVAAKLEPNQPSHQIGIGSALVKLRRFQEAVALLRPLVAQNLKDDVAYFAHTNLATALFELDDFPNAAREFVWVLNYQSRRGDQRRTAVTLYFLGICFDKLGDYEQALKAYEQFLALATATNQLEIDKVKLRLPPLHRQIKEGKGKRKP